MASATGLPAAWPTRYWHPLPDGRVQCDLCPRFCRLREGQRGLCFVRACQDGRIVLTTYGRSSGFCVDPIEKKPLLHFLPGTSVFSFGTAGCNLACRFCQNWDISKSREMDTLSEVAMPEAVAEAAQGLGCRSVAFTYNDPVIFHEYALDVARACRARGIRAVAVTAGYVCPEPRAEFYRAIDAANVDLKGFTERFYTQVCAGHLQPVLDTLLYLKHETTVWLEVTSLLIPGENDLDQELDAMTRWVVRELARRCPCTSPPSTPPGACWTGRRRRPPLWPGRAASPCETASDTPTPATCTTLKGRAPTATGAAAWSSEGTARRSPNGSSPTRAAASSAGRPARASSRARQATGGRGGCRRGSGTAANSAWARLQDPRPEPPRG